MSLETNPANILDTSYHHSLAHSALANALNNITGNADVTVGVKLAVAAAATVDVTLTNPGTSTFDGVDLSTSDVKRILLLNQSSATENGIYDFDTSSTPLTRVADLDSADEFVAGHLVFVIEGATYGGQLWANTNVATVVLGSTDITYEEVISSPPSFTTILKWGNG